MRKNEARLTACVLRRIAVTMAKLPPPPRSAQNRSPSSTRRRTPSAVTTSKLVTRARRRAAPAAAVRGDDVEARHAVERQAERAAREPHPAAERQPARGDGRARAGGDRH